jgi:hypothetical protein
VFFVLFRFCVFITCFVCTSVRTTATECNFNFSNNDDDDDNNNDYNKSLAYGGGSKITSLATQPSAPTLYLIRHLGPQTKCEQLTECTTKPERTGMWHLSEFPTEINSLLQRSKLHDCLETGETRYTRKTAASKIAFNSPGQYQNRDLCSMSTKLQK